WGTAQAEWTVVLGVAYGVGFLTGAQGITFAHELGHGKRKADRMLGWILMTSVNYPQFMVEHYRGHHVRVATREDPASARFGESLWRFLPRSVIGSTIDGWALEARRLRERGKSWLAAPLFWAWAFNLSSIIA